MPENLTLLPTRKVGIGVAVGGLCALVIWALDEFAGRTMPGQAAVGLSSLLTFVAQYIVPNAE